MVVEAKQTKRTFTSTGSKKAPEVKPAGQRPSVNTVKRNREAILSKREFKVYRTSTVWLALQN